MLRRDQDEVLHSPKTAPPSVSLPPEASTDGGNASQSLEAKVGRHESAGPANRTAPAARVQEPKNPLSMVASDLMTSPAIAVSAADPVFSVARRMLESGVNGMPVVDAAGVPIGMVSDGDLIGRRGDRRDDWWLEILARSSAPSRFAQPNLDRPVSEVMSSPLITVARTASVKDIAEAFQAHRVKRLPVLQEGRLIGIVHRADLLSLAGSLPGAPPARMNEGAGLLSFLESMVGGASLRGRLERPAPAPREEKQEQSSRARSAAAFRDAVRTYKAQTMAQKQTLNGDARIERQRQVKILLDQHVSEELWRQLLDRAELAARNGQQEMMLLRFPSDLCSDGGRRIDVAEEGWEGTLRGEAAELYSRWRTELKLQGFGLGARIVSFEEDGIVGDLGLFLTWGE